VDSSAGAVWSETGSLQRAPHLFGVGHQEFLEQKVTKQIRSIPDILLKSFLSTAGHIRPFHSLFNQQ